MRIIQSVSIDVKWESTFKKLTDNEAGVLIKCIISHINNKPLPNPNKLIGFLFDVIKDDFKYTNAPDFSRILRKTRLRSAREISTHSKREWEVIVWLCGNKCVRCGVSGVKIVKDHITPLYLGGSDGVDNLQPLCVKCNSSKKSESIDHRPSNWYVLFCEKIKL